MPTSDSDFYYDLLKIQVQVIGQRNQFLLVFQSMLLAALGIMIDKQHVFFPVWMIIVLGLVVSIVWLYINAVAYTNEEAAEKGLIATSEKFREVLSARKRFWLLSFGNSSKTIAFFFPSLMILFWFTLLCFFIGR